MNKAALTIGCILILGGIFGLACPREWKYTGGSKFSVSQGPLTVSKNGTRILSFGAIILGFGTIFIGKKYNGA